MNKAIDPEISIVIPVYQEEKGLAHAMDGIFAALQSLNHSLEYILVDDGSRDATWQVIRKLTQQNQAVRGVRFSRNFGKELSIYAGVKRARGQAIIVMDGDLQHPPQLIPQMINLWKEKNVDIVEAVKEKRGTESLLYRLASALFYWIWKKLSGIDVTNATDFKLITRRVQQSYIQLNEQRLFFRGITAWLGYPREQILFTVPNVSIRSSRWSLRALFKTAVSSLTDFSSGALRLVNMFAGFFMVLAVILGIRALWVYFQHGAASGITTIIILQLILGSLQLFGLGIVGEYIAGIYGEVKNRPRYIIIEEIDIDHDAK